MNPFAAVITDMREKRLWPLAVVLVALLVALPIVLSKSAPQEPIAQLPLPAPAATTPQVPAIAQQVNPIRSRLHGRQRDPFGQAGAKHTTAQSTTTKPASSAKSSSRSTSATTRTTAKTGTPTTRTTTSTASPSSPTTAPAAPVTKPVTPVSVDLPPTDVYDVAFSITNAHGGFGTVDPLERLSVLPSPQQPLLVELGVLRGGHSVLFAVDPAASVSGPARCIPGPLDCAVLAMSPGQLEALAGKTAGGPVYAEFSVTKIRAQSLGSAAAADRARQLASAAGRVHLRSLHDPVLSLFGYEPGKGAVIDRRNLGVGGNP